VLLVTSDTHRADALGLAGGALETPALDALAARGVAFLDCFAPCNSTNPSHVALMTGESPRDTGVLNNQTRLAEAAPTLAERFAELGYRTWGAISVRHLQPEVSGLGQGFDRMDAPIADEQRRAGGTIERALAWLEGAGETPVFLWVHVFDAHAPYVPPAEFDRRYYPKDKDPLDPSVEAPRFPEGVLAGLSLVGLRDIEFPRAQYRAEVTYLDRELARLFELPRFREGITAAVGDHGESLGEHEIYFGHEGLYPETIRVPLLLAWPGAPSGARVNRGVMHTDLARTLLDLAGAEVVPFAGRDLRRALDEPRGEVGPEAIDAEPRFVLGAHRAEASIALGDHLLILHIQELVESGPRMEARPRHSVELYDLRRDPACRVDRVRKELELARDLRRLLTSWLDSPKRLGWDAVTSQDPGLIADLAKLGYAAAEDAGDAGAQPLWEDDDCGWCRRLR